MAAIDQTIIVTGASSGIGKELTRILSQSGVKVIAIGRDQERLAALAEQSEHIETYAFDLADITEIRNFAAMLIDKYPELNGLVNNAGVQDNLRMDDEGYNVAMIEKEISINLTAPIVLAQALLPHLQSRSHAQIVNITSGLGYFPKRTSAVYSATKAGLHLFTDGLRVQLQKSNVFVAEVILPLVDTPMTAGRGSGKISAKKTAKTIVKGMEQKTERIYVGKASMLPFLSRVAPSIAASILRRG